MGSEAELVQRLVIKKKEWMLWGKNWRRTIASSKIHHVDLNLKRSGKESTDSFLHWSKCYSCVHAGMGK